MDIYIQDLIHSKSINNHYARRYIKFLSKFLHQESVKGVTERHHILPKCKDLFPEYKSFYKNPWNCVHLTKRQHFICHWMLCKIYGDSQIRAFWLMCRGRKIIPSKLYEYLRIEQGKMVSINSKGNKHGKGVKLTQEAINALIERNKKEIKVTSPTGEIYYHKGIKDFCEKFNLNYPCMLAVALGKKRQYKGWFCEYVNNPYPKYQLLSKEERARHSRECGKKKISFISPNGEIGTHSGISDFCKIHKLNRDTVRKLIRGEIDYYKGWIISLIN